MSTIDLFLDELKSEYDRGFELKSSLENKANYILIAAQEDCSPQRARRALSARKIWNRNPFAILGSVAVNLTTASGFPLPSCSSCAAAALRSCDGWRSARPQLPRQFLPA